jgi:heme oxygenase
MQGSSATDWNVRGALRDATSAVHQRLHEARPFAAIAEARLGLEGYRDLLGKIAAFHFTVGAELEVSPDRTQLLMRDLDALGGGAADRVDWTGPATGAAKLGCAYVVEGSALGGKIIYRQLDYLFGERPQGRLFFRGLPRDSARWRSLCRQLEVEGREPGALAEMIAGATGAFALFEQLVSQGHPHG